MDTEFKFDVFLSHASVDKPTVRPLAERLRADGLRVWFDEWEIKPGDNIPAQIEEGLEESRVLVLCMSAAAFGSDWAKLESGTFRFRDPVNKARRFIPLRLDDAPAKGSLAQFLYVDWRGEDHEPEYAKLLKACRPPTRPHATPPDLKDPTPGRVSLGGHTDWVRSVAVTPDGRTALSGADDNTLRLWDLDNGNCIRVLEGHTRRVLSVAVTPDGRKALAGAGDNTLRLWDLENGNCIRVLEGHKYSVHSVAVTPDGRKGLSGSEDNTLRLWDLDNGNCIRVLEGHTDPVTSVAVTPDGRKALSGARDKTLRLWDLENGNCIRVLEGHKYSVYSVAVTPDGLKALSGANDNTLRLWDLENGNCIRVLEGHTSLVYSVAVTPDGRKALSGAWDKTLRLWDLENGNCIRVLEGHTDPVTSVAVTPDGRKALSGAYDQTLRLWDLDNGKCIRVLDGRLDGATDIQLTPMRIGATLIPPKLSITSPPEQVEYTNAKVLLVGNTSAGKTGLANRLARDTYKETDSTVGAWSTQWKIPLPAEHGIEREIWLWDFGGQADQRLIHQLYMAQTQLAVLVFDPQKNDLLDTLGGWDHDLARAATAKFQKLLVAGRIDTGGVRSVSRAEVETFATERGFAGYLETSAKEDIGCDELKAEILDQIKWDEIAKRTSPVLFKRLKEEIVKLKDEGRVLIRFNELRDALQLRLAGEDGRFTDQELKTVVGLLAGPCVVWELGFGSWILLRPELINSHAQALIGGLRDDEREMGCIAEERVLSGDLPFPAASPRLEPGEERIVLFAMHKILFENELCIRDKDPQEQLPTMLVFPSHARRQQLDLVDHPSVIVSYRFAGFLDDIYATLVVRLHHAQPFEREQLWRDAADFKTLAGRRLGVKLTRRAEGVGQIEVYFEPGIPVEEMMIFSKYVHEHLMGKAKDVVRLRHYVCKKCQTPVENRDEAMRRLTEAGKRAKIICVRCEKRVKLWDDLERRFAAPEVQRKVREMEEASRAILDNESKERVLVGEVISTVSLAGQLSREFNVSDHGIDMEIEFKNGDGRATGKKLYLQLKSGDSHLRRRDRDAAEVFDIKKDRHATYWMEQAFPVMLVVRNSKGEIRWMEIRDWLKRASGDDNRPVRQIVFTGERFDVMSVRRWRDKVCS